MMGQFCVLTQNVILVLDAVRSKHTIFCSAKMRFLALYWYTGRLQAFNICRVITCQGLPTNPSHIMI